MNRLSPKNKLMIFSGVGLLLLLITVFQSFANQNDLFSDVLSSQKKLTIQPDKAEMQLASSYHFTSFTESSSGSIPIKAQWKVQSKKDDGTYIDDTNIFLEKCQDNANCILHSGTDPKDLLLIAQSEKGKSEAHVTIKDELPASPYNDNIPDWAKKMVFMLYDKGIMKGYSNNNFGAADPVTRGQVIVLLSNLIKLYGIDTDLFSKGKNCDIYNDLKNDHYAYKPVCAAYYLGWLKDLYVTRGEFNPNEPIRRNEVALIIDNALTAKEFKDFLEIFDKDGDIMQGINKGYISFFDDIDNKVPHYQAIASVKVMGIMNGTRKDTKWFFYPYNTINRAEMATVIGNIIVNMKAKDSTYYSPNTPTI